VFLPNQPNGLGYPLTRSWQTCSGSPTADYRLLCRVVLLAIPTLVGLGGPGALCRRRDQLLFNGDYIGDITAAATRKRGVSTVSRGPCHGFCRLGFPPPHPPPVARCRGTVSACGRNDKLANPDLDVQYVFCDHPHVPAERFDLAIRAMGLSSSQASPRWGGAHCVIPRPASHAYGRVGQLSPSLAVDAVLFLGPITVRRAAAAFRGCGRVRAYSRAGRRDFRRMAPHPRRPIPNRLGAEMLCARYASLATHGPAPTRPTVYREPASAP